MWFRRRRYTLLVMRLADMMFVHPEMDDGHLCSICSEQVGIYPSGQAVIRRYGAKRVDIICSQCRPPGVTGVLAPGALFEPLQSKQK